MPGLSPFGERKIAPQVLVIKSLTYPAILLKSRGCMRLPKKIDSATIFATSYKLHNAYHLHRRVKQNCYFPVAFVFWLKLYKFADNVITQNVSVIFGEIVNYVNKRHLGLG